MLERGIKKSLGRGRMILLEIIADPLAITIEAAICICVAPQPKFCLGFGRRSLARDMEGHHML